MSKRILVTGSRTWDDWKTIYRELQRVADEWDLNYEPDEYGNTLPDPSKMTVVHGGAKGADFWADQWAISNCDLRLVEEHPARWNDLGARAGLIRNEHMVNLGADLCLAFIKDNSRGAAHCLRLAEAAGIECRVFRE